jgi:hypothetical protein
MTDRSRFIPLFILSAILAICPAFALLEAIALPKASAPAWGSLLVIALILIGLLTIFAVSGLWSDLIRGTTEQVNGLRDIHVLTTIAGGVLTAVIISALLLWLATMLPID